MDILNLLNKLKDSDIKLFFEDGQLKAQDLSSKFTSELYEEIKLHKGALISLLSPQNLSLQSGCDFTNAILAKQPGINKILPILESAEKISANSFCEELKVDASRSSLGNYKIIDLSQHTEALVDIYKNGGVDNISHQGCRILDNLISDILPYISVGGRDVNLDQCLYYAFGGGGASIPQIHSDTDWLQFPDADGFQIWFLLENPEKTGNMFLVDTPLQSCNDMPQCFDFKSDGTVHREHLCVDYQQVPINIFNSIDDCKFRFRYLDMKSGDCLLFSKRQLHMSDPRTVLQNNFSNRLAIYMRIIIKKDASSSIKFWPNHSYKNKYKLINQLSKVCDENLNINVDRYSMVNYSKLKIFKGNYEFI